MPDKVHAVRALEILDKYNLSEEETKIIHKKAQDILGSAYENYKIVNRGGENDMSNEAIDKLVEAIANLTKKVEAIEKAWEGAFKPVAGSKEIPTEKTYTPDLKESAPSQSGAADDVQTQDPKGAYPAKGPVKAANPATSSLKTQEDMAAPFKKDEEPADVEKAKNPATSDLKTQPEEGAYPAKGPIKAEACPAEDSPAEEAAESAEEEATEDKKKHAKKSEGSENDLSKIVSAVDSLRKRFDKVEEVLSRPMPRKTKIEKNFDGSTNEDSKLQDLEAEVLKWNASGKALTTEQERIQKMVLDARLDRKFGKSL
jgi:hypothetical protein